MKINVLAENTAINDSLTSEHGLSLYIETDKNKILFDSGQTDAFAENAEKIGVDLTSVDFAVLSHGHYDHGGGMLKFTQINNTAPIYINKNAFGEYYNGTQKFIGIDKELKTKNIILTDDAFKISDKIELFTCNDKNPDFSNDSAGLNELKNGEFVQDGFEHEQYMLVIENGRKILFSGCSHKGILNIVEWVKPDVFIGGFHLVKLDPGTDGKEKLEYIARKLLENNCRYYTCHCTGLEQYDYLKNLMKDKLEYISTGREFEI